MKVHVAIDVLKLYRRLVSEGTRFITTEGLAEELSISTRSAGKLLSKMQERGLVTKCSKSTYKILYVDRGLKTNRVELLLYSKSL